MSRTISHWEIHYMPAAGGYLHVDAFDNNHRDVRVVTSGAACLKIRMPHPYETGQTVEKSIPWHRVNYVERVDREVPDSA